MAFWWHIRWTHQSRRASLPIVALIPANSLTRYVQVTICSAIFRRFPWKKVPLYILGQVLGAFFGSLFVYSNYFHAIDLFEGGKGVRTVPGTASLFATYSVSSNPDELIAMLLN